MFQTNRAKCTVTYGPGKLSAVKLKFNCVKSLGDV